MAARRHTILIKILIPLLLAMLVQAGLIFSVILFGGTTSQLKANAYDILSERVISRKNDLENEMVQRWSNVYGPMQAIQDLTDAVLVENEIGPASLDVNGNVTNALLRELSTPLLNMLRTNSVTGAFVIFDGSGTPDKKAGLHVRDADPSSNPGDNSDLLVVRGPSSVTKYLSIPMDTLWQPSFSLSRTDDSLPSDYYYKPLLAARSHTELSAADLGCWSRPFYLNGRENENDSTQIITYSLALLYKGAPIGCP